MLVENEDMSYALSAGKAVERPTSECFRGFAMITLFLSPAGDLGLGSRSRL